MQDLHSITAALSLLILPYLSGKHGVVLYEFLYFHSSLSRSSCSISQSVILCQLSLSLSLSLSISISLCLSGEVFPALWMMREVREHLRSYPQAFTSRPARQTPQGRGQRAGELQDWRCDWGLNTAHVFYMPTETDAEYSGSKNVTNTHICCQNKNSTYGTILNFHNIYWAIYVYYLQFYNY